MLRLARYSPDYNPIETAISKAKNLLRTLAARSINGLIDAIDQLLLSITANVHATTPDLVDMRYGRKKFRSFESRASAIREPNRIVRVPVNF